MKNKNLIMIIITSILAAGVTFVFIIDPMLKGDQNRTAMNNSTAAVDGIQMERTLNEKEIQPSSEVGADSTAPDTIAFEMGNPTPEVSEIEPEPEIPAAVDQEETPGEPAPEVTPTATPIPPNPKEYLIRSRRQPAIIPQDFEIGDLQNRTDSSVVKRILYNQINYFLYYLTVSTIDTDRISPDWRTTLNRSLEYYLGKGYKPKRYRIGAITLTNGNLKAHASIRLYGDPGITEGEIYLEVDGQYWYISDIQADFSALSRPYEIPEEPFEPETFKYLLEG